MTDLTCIFYINRADGRTVLYKTQCSYLKNEEKVYTGHKSYIENHILYIPYCPYLIKLNIPDKMLKNEHKLTGLFNKKSDVTINFFKDNDADLICLKEISFDSQGNDIYNKCSLGLFLRLDILTKLQHVNEDDISLITQHLSEFTMEVSK